MHTQIITEVISIIGIIAFAFSGAIAATKKHTDPFGTILVAVSTSCGGGIMRDIILGIVPPYSLRKPAYILISSAAALFIYLAAFLLKDSFDEKISDTDAAVNIFDALGLGVFVASGTQNAIDLGFSQNVFLCIFTGVLTGCGGSFLRDIMLREIPIALRKDIYIIAAFFGSLIFYILHICGAAHTFSIFFSVSATFLLRIFASHFKWNLPPAY